MLLSTLSVSGISGTELPASLISGCDPFHNIIRIAETFPVLYLSCHLFVIHISFYPVTTHLLLTRRCEHPRHPGWVINTIEVDHTISCSNPCPQLEMRWTWCTDVLNKKWEIILSLKQFNQLEMSFPTVPHCHKIRLSKWQIVVYTWNGAIQKPTTSTKSPRLLF